MGEDINHRHFVALISEKLPQKVLYQLYMLKAEGEEWTVPKLQQLLEKHITALEMAGGEPRPAPMPVKPITKYTQGGVSGQSKSTAGGLLAGSHKAPVAQKQSPLQPKCIYCSQDHWSDECTKFAVKEFLF